jgi:hypothetical protein
MISPHRSCLLPNTIEAGECIRNWGAAGLFLGGYLRICQAASAYKALQPPAEYACLLIGKGKTTTARVPCSSAPTESGGQDETAPAGVWCSAPKWGERRLGVTAKALPCVTSISRTESPSALRRSPSCYLILHVVCSVWPATRPKM